METMTDICLINQMFKNIILFEKKDDIFSYNIEMCEDYDNLNLYRCNKKLSKSIDKNNFIKQLSKIEIRNSLFDSYFNITKIETISKTNWIEKIIYNNQNYNIQIFVVDNASILCYSDFELDDNTIQYSWINNPFTKIQIDEEDNLILEIAFEISNQYQNEIIRKFLQCLDKLELALIVD
jgi:hypothetical protein